MLKTGNSQRDVFYVQKNLLSMFPQFIQPFVNKAFPEGVIPMCGHGVKFGVLC